MRLLPTYLVIGAQKGGTTFLQAMLAQHPAIVRNAPGKEIHYFDWHYHRGTAWYRSHFPTRATRNRVRRQCGEFATGERSPNYLFHPDVPERVAGLLPDVKLLVVLRNPVDRALSDYQQERRRGKEELSFEEALAWELRQRETRRDPPRSEPPRNPRLGLRERPRFYLARGLYAQQLERWLAVFDREQIHVSVSERLFSDPAREIDPIHRFIGVTPRAPFDLRPRNDATYDPIPSELRTRLQGFFEADVARLTDLLGVASGWW